MPDYKMVDELVESYSVMTDDEGRVNIMITVPWEYRDLWMVKLGQLTATDDEIRSIGEGKEPGTGSTTL